ncbi:MAG TPA: hypothetical protein VNJ46_01910 [Gaiellaceae bacterium]|nr:hypothetical protein [Gaiellaceae bacterium]
MSRPNLILLIALGIGLAGFALSSTADRAREGGAEAEASVAAGPQRAELRWRETHGPPGQRLVFTVDWLEVVPGGWRARVGFANESEVAYEVGDPQATVDRAFGLMLFSTGDLRELKERNASGTLPAPRRATRFRPELPSVLEPGDSWEGTISASGALVAGAWVRVVFGAFLAIGRAPEELPKEIVWITDRAYRLER